MVGEAKSPPLFLQVNTESPLLFQTEQQLRTTYLNKPTLLVLKAPSRQRHPYVSQQSGRLLKSCPFCKISPKLMFVGLVDLFEIYTDSQTFPEMQRDKVRHAFA